MLVNACIHPIPYTLECAGYAQLMKLYYMGYGSDQVPRTACEYLLLIFDEEDRLKDLSLRALTLEY